MSCNIPWAKFRSKKGGVKAHVLYDIEAQVPAFYTVTTASKHDSTAMSSIHYEPNAYYIFDRAYDSFKELYRIHLTDSFFVVRAKTNLKYKTVKWKRRMPKNIMTDAEVKLTGYLSGKKYPESFRLVRYYDEEDDRELTFSDECETTFCIGCRQSLQEKMVDRAVLQMAQAAPQDKEILGHNRERRPHTNQCRYYHILSCGYCPT